MIISKFFENNRVTDDKINITRRSLLYNSLFQENKKRIIPSLIISLFKNKTQVHVCKST